MLTFIAMLLAAAPVAPEPATVVPGRCQYPDRVVRDRQDTVLILCDTATIDRDGETVTLDFGQRSWGSTARVMGTVTGRTVTVQRITPRGKDSAIASGTCTIEYRDRATPSIIACLARVGSRRFAVNFIASRL